MPKDVLGRVYQTKKSISRLSVLILILVALAGCAKDTKTTASVADIAKYGNLILDITGADLFDQGYEYGDLLEVTVADQTWELPLCANYSDVDTGVTVLRATSPEEAVVLAINMGDFATTAGIAAKAKIEEEPGYRWDYLTQTPVRVKIALKQEDGYREQWLMHQLVRTDERGDYSHLSDEAFANFRAVDTTGMGEKKLYRSSSPINPAIGRNTCADKAARDAGIATVVNLADASNTYESPSDTYYLTCQVVYLNLGMDFVSEDSAASLARGMRFIKTLNAAFDVKDIYQADPAAEAEAFLPEVPGLSADEVTALKAKLGAAAAN